MADSLDLTDERKREIQRDSTDRLEFVLESLNDADELSSDVDWQTELWSGCTVEEVLGALVEAEAEVEDDGL